MRTDNRNSKKPSDGFRARSKAGNPKKGFRHRKQGQRHNKSAPESASKTPANLVPGKRALQTILKTQSERVKQVFTAKDESAQSELKALLKQACKREVAVVPVPAEELARLCGHTAHQGILTELDPTAPLDLAEVIAANRSESSSLIVVLDSIEDPNNFGSILRACECFGVDAVIYSGNRGCQLTPTVRKVSAGASELVPIVEVSNLANAITKLKDADYWIVATALDESSKNVMSFDFPKRSVIVLGSEGNGIRHLLLELADFKIQIPMHGAIDSLNVGQACAVTLSAYRACQSSTSKE